MVLNLLATDESVNLISVQRRGGRHATGRLYFNRTSGNIHGRAQAEARRGTGRLQLEQGTFISNAATAALSGSDAAQRH